MHRTQPRPGRTLAIVVAVAVVFPVVGLALFPHDPGPFVWIVVALATAFVLGSPALIVAVAWSGLRQVRAARAVAADVAVGAGWTAATRDGALTYLGRHRGRAVALQATIARAPHLGGSARGRFGAHPVLRFTVGEGADAVSFDLPPKPLEPQLLIRLLDAAIGEA